MQLQLKMQRLRQQCRFTTADMGRIVTLTEFMINDQHMHPDATGRLTLLLLTIENAGKMIASHVKKTGLVDLIGKTGDTNTTGDEVKKLDVFANDVLIDMLTQCNQVAMIGSEELSEPILTKEKNAPYDIFFDPLDGSNNIDTQMVMGTFFSIYRHTHSTLQKGNQQIAAGYILYGSSVMFVYCAGSGVHGFTYDPSIGSFLLSHPSMRVPKNGSRYFVNEANVPFMDMKAKQFIAHLKEKGTYKQRSTGCAVAETHSILIHGGIFFYPKNTKQKNGKLRLMYEGNPIGFLMEHAGGKTITHEKPTLALQPQDIHQQVPLIFGSEEIVQAYIGYPTDLK